MKKSRFDKLCPLFENFDFERALRGHSKNELGFIDLFLLDENGNLITNREIKGPGIKIAGYTQRALDSDKSEVRIEDFRQELLKDSKLKRFVEYPLDCPKNGSFLEGEMRWYSRVGFVSFDQDLGDKTKPFSQDYKFKRGPNYKKVQVDMRLIPDKEKFPIQSGQWSNGVSAYTLAPLVCPRFWSMCYESISHVLPLS
ncbi:MAG: hypothetical protein ACYSSN_06640 [Planctomycetota bacterium]|jgi:hypothetical protein